VEALLFAERPELGFPDRARITQWNLENPVFMLVATVSFVRLLIHGERAAFTTSGMSLRRSGSSKGRIRSASKR
jgi:hypothetical protein